jgi:hypothetical protein
MQSGARSQRRFNKIQGGEQVKNHDPRGEEGDGTLEKQ